MQVNAGWAHVCIALHASHSQAVAAWVCLQQLDCRACTWETGLLSAVAPLPSASSCKLLGDALVPSDTFLWDSASDLLDDGGVGILFQRCNCSFCADICQYTSNVDRGHVLQRYKQVAVDAKFRT